MTRRDDDKRQKTKTEQVNKEEIKVTEWCLKIIRRRKRRRRVATGRPRGANEQLKGVKRQRGGVEGP